MKELLKKAFDAGMNRQWSIDYQENVKTRPSFEEWYKENESEVLALHNVSQQRELLESFVDYAKGRSIRDINIDDDTILYFLEDSNCG